MDIQLVTMEGGMLKMRNLMFLIVVLMASSAACAGVIGKIDCSSGGDRPVMEQ